MTAAKARRRRRLRATASLGWVALALLGLPAVLITTVGWPLPRRVPDRAQLQEWLAEPLRPSVLVAAVVCVLWLLWAVAVYAVLAEVAGRLLRWRLPRLRLAAPLHTAAAAAVGAAAVALAQAGSGSPPTTGGTSPVQVSADRHPDSHSSAASAGARRGAADQVQRETTDLDERARPPADVVAAVPAELVIALAAVAAAVWLARRRGYVPRPLVGSGRDDSDLDPLPPVLAAAHGTAADLAPANSSGPAAAARFGLADLPAGGLGLTGPGADDAARALLVAAVLSACAGGPWRVSAAAGLLRRLAGRLADTDAGVWAGLGVYIDPPPSGRPSPQAVDASAPTGIRVLQLREGPPRRRAARTAAAGLLPVVVGAGWPRATTWHVDSDGHTDASRAGAAAGMLSAAATADVLEAVRVLPQPIAPYGPAGRPPVTRGPDQPAVRGRLTLRLLGAVTLIDRHGAPVAVARSAAVQALALLAAHPDGATDATLTAMLWPGVRRHIGASRLKTALSHLRGVLREACDGASVLNRHGQRHRLDPDNLDVDVWRLHRAVASAATAIGAAARRSALLAVVAAYPGEFAAGYEWPWLGPYRERLRRDVVDALCALADDEPDPATAVAHLHAAARHAPDNEAVHRELMRAQAAANDVDGVQHTLARLTSRLAAHGQQPARATRQLAEQLRNDAAPQ